LCGGIRVGEHGDSGDGDIGAGAGGCLGGCLGGGDKRPIAAGGIDGRIGGDRCCINTFLCRASPVTIVVFPGAVGGKSTSQCFVNEKTYRKTANASFQLALDR
jgi:hypothetical protein